MLGLEIRGPTDFDKVNSPLFFSLFETHTHRIDAVSDATLISRSIWKAMSQVTPTIGAENFFAYHKVAVVHLDVDGLRTNRFRKTRPTATAVVLFGGVENLISTGTAFVDPGILIQIILPGKGALGAFFT